MDDTRRGLYGKYRVERVDGKGIGRCIVLELDDPNTWPALKVWADTVEAAGHAALAKDVRKWVATAEGIERVFGPATDNDVTERAEAALAAHPLPDPYPFPGGDGLER